MCGKLKTQLLDYKHDKHSSNNGMSFKRALLFVVAVASYSKNVYSVLSFVSQCSHLRKLETSTTTFRLSTASLHQGVRSTDSVRFTICITMVGCV